MGLSSSPSGRPDSSDRLTSGDKKVLLLAGAILALVSAAIYCSSDSNTAEDTPDRRMPKTRRVKEGKNRPMAVRNNLQPGGRGNPVEKPRVVGGNQPKAEDGIGTEEDVILEELTVVHEGLAKERGKDEKVLQPFIVTTPGRKPKITVVPTTVPELNER